MKVSLNWLKELVELPYCPEELSQKLLFLGFEVSQMEKAGPSLDKVVVGHVLEVRKHPNADRLSLCRVSDGSREYSVVCGAPNVQSGQKIPLALLGAVLPGGKVIEKVKIRGEESSGMICSGSELGIEESSPDGIYVLSSEAPLGKPVQEVLGLEDTVLDVEVTPNRPDCLSHFGLAREISTALSLPLRPPVVQEGREGGSVLSVPVSIENPQDCPRYIGRSFEGVRVAPSPGWMAQRLSACGIRPINNLVDVTNYVLLELGHPLHVFDRDRLAGPAIEVRRARKGESLKALDGREYGLDPDCLVVADSGRPAALAGVIGGSESSVSEKTQNVFLECASFHPGLIRRTAKRLKIRTESSYRFERGVPSPALSWAARRASELILKCSPKAVAGGFRDAYPKPAPPKWIEISSQRLDSALGVSLEKESCEKYLKGISAGLESSEGGWRLLVPDHRLDLAEEADVVEEVARHLGYDNIPEEFSSVTLTEPETSEELKERRLLRERLSALGFSEAYHYDFVSSEELSKSGFVEEPALLENPTSLDLTCLRPTLVVGLLRSLFHNLSRQAERIALFELGTVYVPGPKEIEEYSSAAGIWRGPWPLSSHWQSSSGKFDFYRLKGAVESLLSLYKESSADAAQNVPPYLHSKVCGAVLFSSKAAGFFGQVHPWVCRQWGLGAEPVWFFEFRTGNPLRSQKVLERISSYPFSQRDLSFVVSKEFSWKEVEEAVRGSGVKDLQEVELIDLFTGKGISKGTQSLTLRLTFSSLERTLKEEEVRACVERVLEALKSRFNARQRT